MKTGSLSLGEAIALARNQAGLTQTELGEKLGMSKRSVQEYEADNISALKHLQKIEEATGKPAGWIMSRVDPYEQVLGMAESIRRMEDMLHEVLALLRRD